MLRVKIPAGLLQSAQAEELCRLSHKHSNGMLHLTSRGSIEFHWLEEQNLEPIFAALKEIGLTSRGACGGAVRGISCSTTFAPGFAAVQAVAVKLNRHFAGNPAFEGLPKKFKIGIDAGYAGARHLIQDLGLVLVKDEEGRCLFDVWCAGGLGKEPQPAFLLEQEVAEESLLHLVESVVQVYRDNTPPPKRLKTLLNTIGETEFRRLLQQELASRPQPSLTGDDDVAPVASGHFVEVPVFAGEIKAAQLNQLAALAREGGSGYLAVTNDQNIALLAGNKQESEVLSRKLQETGFFEQPFAFPSRFRVCPGNHECRMGLSPTRDVAASLCKAMPSRLQSESWAISGCRNSCPQPQLAGYGIVSKKLMTDADGNRVPLFDLYHREGDGLGQCIAEELSIESLSEAVSRLS